MRCGENVGPEFARTMLLKILPGDLTWGVIKSRDLYHVNEISSWVKSQLVWDRSNELAEKSMRLGRSVNSLGEKHGAEPMPAEPRVAPMDDIAQMIAAIQGGQGGNRGRRNDKGGGSASPRSSHPKTRTLYGNA